MKNMLVVGLLLIFSAAMLSGAERVVVCEEMYAEW